MSSAAPIASATAVTAVVLIGAFVLSLMPVTVPSSPATTNLPWGLTALGEFRALRGAFAARDGLCGGGDVGLCVEASPSGSLGDHAGLQRVQTGAIA